MKSNRIRVTFIFLLLATFLVSMVGFAFTTARYSKELESQGNVYTGNIEYVVADQLEVRTAEQFISAVENGYTNIKIADDVPNPLLITAAPADVNTDLILDLNGHDIQRNNREPLLNITSGVKMVVIDTSTGGSGSFYNPVGSVLAVKGGTLTVMSGKFESGPRKEEYLSAEEGIHGTIADAEDLTVYVASSEGYISKESVRVPIITPVIYTYNGFTYVGGNIYFDSEVEGYGEISNEKTATSRDNYLYYIIDDAEVTSTNLYSEGSADFYYEYYVTKVDGEYQYSGTEKTDDTVKVTIYGYYDDVEEAVRRGESESATATKFAAIQMEEGELTVMGGEYASYFGVGSAYCVYSKGGRMTVQAGKFSAIEAGVCIRNSFTETSAENKLIVQGGDFFSQKGDTIQVVAGQMEVTGGAFWKDASATSNDNAVKEVGNRTKDLENGAAISVSGESANLTVTGTASSPISFELTGSGINAIECLQNAKLTVEYIKVTTGRFSYTLKSSEAVDSSDYTGKGAISSSGGETTVEDTYGINNLAVFNDGGEVEVVNCEFVLDSDTSAGIVSRGAGGKVESSGSVYQLSGIDSKGIYQLGGTVTVPNGYFSMTNVGAIGILASAGTVEIGDKTAESNADYSYDNSAESNAGYSYDNSVFFYIDHVQECYGVWADLNESENNTLDKTDDGTSIVDEESEVTVKLYSAQFFIGQGYETTGGDKVYYYNSENEYTEKFTRGNGDIFCAGIYSNLSNSNIEVGRTLVLVAGSYSAGIYALQGNISSINSTVENYSDTDVNKAVLFVGQQYAGYLNGGKDANGNWLYSRQAEEFYKQGAEIQALSSSGSTGSYGIASFGGTIRLNSVYANLWGTGSSGLYASGSEASASTLVTLYRFEADIEDTRTDYLSTSALSVQNGGVEINYCNVSTTGIGITVVDGSLSFGLKNEAGAPLTLSTPYDDEKYNVRLVATRSNAIYLGTTTDSSGTTTDSTAAAGGDSAVGITFGSNTVAYISSEIAATEDSSNQTALPWQQKVRKENGTDETATVIYHYDGIKVQGGTFTSSGSLTVDFTGLDNDTSYATSDEYVARFMLSSVSSYAIAVTNGDFTATGTLNVTSTVGGGVTVQGGNVVIGGEESKDSDSISVKTEGKDITKDYAAMTTQSGLNWYAAATKDGGHALEVIGGNLTVWNGSFTAAMGNAIRVNSSDKDNLPEITIYDGTFRGNMEGFSEYMTIKYPSGSSRYEKTTGPGSFFGLKVMGGCTVKVYGGTFTGGGGGAFVTGVTEISSENELKTNGQAVVYIYAGTFDGEYDAFNVYDNSNVIFGAYKEGEYASDDYLTALRVTSNKKTATIAVNPFFSNNQSSTVTVYYGTYNYNFYRASGTITVYNTGYNTASSCLSCVVTNDATFNYWTGTQVFYSGN